MLANVQVLIFQRLNKRQTQRTENRIRQRSQALPQSLNALNAYKPHMSPDLLSETLRSKKAYLSERFTRT